jgi:hypothetical protein
MKEVKEKDGQFLSLLLFSLYHSVIAITTRKDGYDINDFTLLLNLFISNLL